MQSGAQLRFVFVCVHVHVDLSAACDAAVHLRGWAVGAVRGIESSQVRPDARLCSGPGARFIAPMSVFRRGRHWWDHGLRITSATTPLPHTHLSSLIGKGCCLVHTCQRCGVSQPAQRRTNHRAEKVIFTVFCSALNVAISWLIISYKAGMPNLI